MSHAFKPSFWMKNKHLQTVYQTFFRKIKEPKFSVQRFVFEDGDFTDAYWLKTKNSQENTPLVILFHGLAGSYKSPYVQGMMLWLTKAGYNTVLMHFRGCAGEPNLMPRSYHSGETGDASYFISCMHERFAHAKLFCIGFSLGGNMLLKLLGEGKVSSLVHGAVSVSPPMELSTCSNAINKGFSLVYQSYLVKGLIKGLLEKYKVCDIESLLGISTKDVKKYKTFWDFDGGYTAPVHGFSSAQDYYTKCSSRQFLKDIHIPTLIIHSSDDPFMDESIIPSTEELSSSVTLEVSVNGGHVGFIEGSFFKPKYWLEQRVVSFFNLNNR